MWIEYTVSDQHERSKLMAFGHIDRINMIQITKQIYDGKINRQRGKKNKKNRLDEVDKIVRKRQVRSLKRKGNIRSSRWM